jgi:hypothetical protein
MKFQGRLLTAALVVMLVAGLFGGAFAQGKPPAKVPAGKAPAGKAPRAIVNNLTIQAGEVLEGQPYQNTFIIRNAGDAELQILSVRPG